MTKEEKIKKKLKSLKSPNSILFIRFVKWMRGKTGDKTKTIDHFLNSSYGLEANADEFIRSEIWRIIDNEIQGVELIDTLKESKPISEMMFENNLMETDFIDSWKSILFPN